MCGRRGVSGNSGNCAAGRVVEMVQTVEGVTAV